MMLNNPTVPAALLSAERLAEMQELHDAWLVYRAANPDYLTTKESVFLELVRGHRRELLGHVEHLEAENARLSARLREEEETTADLRAKLAHEGEQEKQILKRDEELRKLKEHLRQIEGPFTERERLENRINALENGFGYGSWRDGLTQMELDKAQQQLAQLPDDKPNDAPASPLGKSEEGRGAGEGVQGE